MWCTLPHTDATPGIPREVRMMDVFYESLEDLYLLAHCTRLATTSSSHFSTFATMLMWATTGVAGVTATAFLDKTGIDEGSLQSAFLHGALNGTTRAEPGVRRWSAHTTRFIEGSWEATSEEALFEPGAVSVRIHNEDSLPYLAPDVFWPEVLRWSSQSVCGSGCTSFHIPHSLPCRRAYVQDVLRVWPGECPVTRKDNQTELNLIGENINFGAEHTERLKQHFHQAIKCWAEAYRILQSLPAEYSGASAHSIEQIRDVLQGNLQAVRSQQMDPYSYTSQHLASAVLGSVFVSENATLSMPFSSVINGLSMPSTPKAAQARPSPSARSSRSASRSYSSGEEL